LKDLIIDCKIPLELILKEQNKGYNTLESSGSVAYPEIFFEGGFNKFSWGQRADRMGIWGR